MGCPLNIVNICNFPLFYPKFKFLENTTLRATLGVADKALLRTLASYTVVLGLKSPVSSRFPFAANMQYGTQ